MKIRWWLWLLALVLLGVGLLRLRFDIEVLNLLPPDLPSVQGLKVYQRHFSGARELVITLSAGDADAAESAAGSLAAALRKATQLVARVVWQPPWLERPGDAAELAAFLWLNQPPEIFSALTNRLAGDNAANTLSNALAKLSVSLSPQEIARLGYDPFGLLNVPAQSGATAPAFATGDDLFVSEDGTFRLLFVHAAAELGSYRECASWLSQIQDLVASWQSSLGNEPKMAVKFTGAPAFVAEIAGGMERDMRNSVAGTLGMIAMLFWCAHRTWRPLLWLTTVLVGVLAGTLALGGLLFGALNVVSAGFAAILLGLAVDYALVLYQEHRSSPEASWRDTRRAVAPSIAWSALTTAGAFALLNFGGLPGLGQLGSLVALGVLLAGVAMLFCFLPRVAREQTAAAGNNSSNAFPPSPTTSAAPTRSTSQRVVSHSKAVGIGTASLVLVFLAVIWARFPGIDATTAALRPRDSAAHAALAEIKAKLGRDEEPFWLIVSAATSEEMARRLDRANVLLASALSNQIVVRLTLPAALWPRADRQQANRPPAAELLRREDSLRQQVLAAGFNSNALAVTERVFAAWRAALSQSNVFAPSNSVTAFISGKAFARDAERWLALGLVYPTEASGQAEGGVSGEFARWLAELRAEGFWLTGWELLGAEILAVVQRDLIWVMAAVALLVLVCLWAAFRNFVEVLLSLAAVVFGGLALSAWMSVANWSWNLMNLVAVPLLLGAGIDYTIHMQLALRRHGLLEARRIVGRALLLCAATTVAGFGSLAWSSNAGLASLGKVCATGIGLLAVTSIYVLPLWWRIAHRQDSGMSAEQRHPTAAARSQEVDRPSSLYRARLWQLGLSATRVLPPHLCAHAAQSLSACYGRLAQHRREIVTANLLPACGGDRSRAAAATEELFRNFGQKIADLWRYESGESIDDLICGWSGWEHLAAAQARGQGVLLVTPHVGNWEFGAPLLIRKGVHPLVISLVEPDADLTRIRQNSRARWGIETLVIGEDPFAFVEVIRRLQSGAVVALLVDRPPKASAAEVELFGRKFAASIAPAELARASGCAILPVCLPRSERGYSACMLPEIPYDRRALGDREARRDLTQRILRAFEPIIRQYIAQWYHFVPVWPR